MDRAIPSVLAQSYKNFEYVIVGDHCHIATGAILNGGVVVGSGSFIGSGVVTKQSVAIGNNCIVGAGVILKKNIRSNEVIAN